MNKFDSFEMLFMRETTFKDYLSSHIPIGEKDIASLLDNCSIRVVEKDTYLLQPDEYCEHTFFVEKGLLRQFSMDEKGKEHILAFAPENWFVSDRESVHFQLPASYYVQALEDSRVVLLNNEIILKLSRSLPSFSDFNLQLLHNHIRHLQKRIELLLSASAEDRYLQFIKMYPDILLRVPQSMVASYLGIAPESLSRVRRDLAKKNFKA